MDRVVRQTGGSAKTPRPHKATPRKRSHRKHRRIERYAWLAAGLVGFGMTAAATAGAAVAYADDTAGTSSSSSSSADSGSANGAADASKTDGEDRATTDDAGDKTTGVDDTAKPSEQPSEGDSSKDGSGADTVEESTEATDVEADDEAATDRSADKRSRGSDSRKAIPVAPVNDDPAPRTTFKTDSRTATSILRTPKPAVEVDQSASDSAGAAAMSVFAAAEPSDDAAVDAANSAPAQASGSVSITETQPKAASAPAPEPDLPAAPTALLAGLQMTAAARPVQRPIEETAVALTVSETVPVAAEADVQSLDVTLAAAESVLPPTKEDAGLSGPFLAPEASTGRTINIQTYGATSNDPADNDATVINAIINAAQPGDTVYIPNGTYHIKSTINLKTGVSLVGQSRDNTVLAVVSPGDAQGHAVVYAPPGVSNLTVSNFTITLASGRPPLAGVRLGNTTGAPVSRIAVNNLFIEKFERFGVELDNANNILVDGNIIKNATALNGTGQGYGILISGDDTYNNWISNNTIGPVIRHAILIQGAHNNLVENNRITGTVSGAIDLHGEDEYANEIRYNVISDGVRNGTTVSPNGAGIEVGEYSGVIGTDTMHDNSGPGNYIHHNTVYNYSYGFRITNNSNYTFVEDNVFYNNDEVGILANLAPLNNLYISRNEVYDNAHGILLYGVTQAVVTDNILRDNPGIGIGIDPQTYPYVITGNTVTNNGMNVYLGNPLGVYIP